MKRTTWLTRVIAVFAAVLVSFGIWTAVDGTAPGTAGTTGGVVTDASFSQTDDFLTRSTPVISSQSSASSQTARYRTTAS